MACEVLAIVVTFNRKNLLRQAIMALLNQSYRELDILIVDNASTDGTKEYIQDFLEKKSVYYINTNKNLGGAGGFAYGIKAGVAKGYKYLWLMDDDTIPTEDALEELCNAKNVLHDKFGFLCGYVEWIDGTPCRMNVPIIDTRLVDYMNLLNHGLISVQCASFVSFFVKSSVVREVGLPIKEFFIWVDDQEFSRRISKLYSSFFVYKSKVVHKMHSNTPASICDDRGDRLNRYELLYRNCFYYAKKNGKKQLLLYFKFIIQSIHDILCKATDKKGQRLLLLIKGFIKGIFFNPTIDFPE